MAKQVRVQRKLKAKHRAVKPRVVRPLDVRKDGNHEDRHEAAKLKRAAHEALMVDQAHDAALREDVRRGLAADVEEDHSAALVDDSSRTPCGNRMPADPDPGVHYDVPRVYHHNCSKIAHCGCLDPEVQS